LSSAARAAAKAPMLRIGAGTWRQGLYVATATAGDDEMKVRIENHRAERPADWRTLEAPLHVGEAIERELAEHSADVVLLDCMTLLATNVILQLPENANEKEASEALSKEVDALLACMKKSNAQWIIVSNEVGLGLVPPIPWDVFIAMRLVVRINNLRKSANRVIWMVAGIPSPSHFK
jgi:adenosylcobinamide kinase / adenosylcobinamide-phosphate guanylyltransferase